MSTKDNQNRIGNYQFIKTIGKGTFGKVKLSIHLPTNEYVAIKILEKSLINDEISLERIKKEIKYLKSFNHPHIIQIYEVKEDSNNYYIIMEYVTGGELFNYIVKNGKLSEKEASFFLTQIIYGVKEIHRKKICHRDIKPENLLLTDKKIIKIIDFGLSNEYIDFLSSQCGSPCYAAPEMIRGMKYSGVMIDLWACGIILFAMLCGYLPFDDSDNNIVFRKILKCKIEFPSEQETHLSNDAKDLITRILTPNPLKRIKIDEVLEHPFLKSGIQDYKSIMKPTFFNQESIIIDYMVNKLKCSNENNFIFKLVRANRHNGYTTTYKLLKKKIMEGRFDYNYNKESTSLSPIVNIKFHNFFNNNNQNIKTSLSKITKENNNINGNLRNRGFSTDSPRNTQINEINIEKNNKYSEENALFGLKNNNLFLNDNIKNNVLYQKLILKNKNVNNFKRDIDTSVSKEKIQNKKNKKIISKTPPRFMVNPIIYEKITPQNNDNNLYSGKNIYFPNNLTDKRNGLSADKINPKTITYIPNPLVTKIFGPQNNIFILKKGVMKGFVISKAIENNNKVKYSISADKASNKFTRHKNNHPKNNDKIYINNNIPHHIQKNKNIRYISPDNNFNNINYKRININDIEKTYKYNIPKNNNITNEITSINNLNINTLQVNIIDNYTLKNENNKNNILNKNIIYNNNNNCYQNNYKNAIKEGRKSRFENDRNKLRNQINNNNIKYIPIALRDKKNPLNQNEIIHYINKSKNIQYINETKYNDKNNIILNKEIKNKGEIKYFHTNLTIQQIKTKLIKFCRKYKHKYIDSNNNKYIIFVNDVNSFVLEIIFEFNNRILKLYHKFGIEAITNENMEKFLLEINNKIESDCRNFL